MARKAAGSKPANNAARRRKRTAIRPQQPGDRRPAAQAPKQDAMPGWRELATSNERDDDRRPRVSAFIEKVSTVRFGLLLLAVAAVITLYVGHVHATRDLLAEVQRDRRDNLRLHLKMNRLKADFDRATAPAVVYEKAREMGLYEDIHYGPTIKVE